jgi:multidrug efflux pump subunit AcrA (membrane-fusion protein)
MRRKVIIMVVAAVVVAAGGIATWLYFRANPAAWQAALADVGVAEPETDAITASGFIEAEEIALAPEIGGRLEKLSVEEGEDIEAGRTVARLDTTLIDAQIAAAEADLEAAGARLLQAEERPRPEALRQAEAGVRLAYAARDGAYQAWQDAIAVRENPQELDVQIAQARARVATAAAAVERAEALKDAAEIGYENFHDVREAVDEAQEQWAEIPEPARPPRPTLETQLDFHLIPNQYWKAWIGLNTAKAELQAARTALNDLYRIREDPQTLDAQVNSAKARYEAAEAGVEQAEAKVAALSAGASEEQVAALAAQVRQAEASLETLQNQRDKLTIAAPVGGLVLDIAVHEGELAPPGATILTMGMLDEVTLTVYVPQDRLGEVRIGQTAEVRADGTPDRTFTGKVVAIAGEAEFTPRNVQTKEERVNMVFGVDIRVPNPEHLLKPGGHAEATIPTGGE